jgi:ParB family chromosome partitioning protein
MAAKRKGLGRGLDSLLGASAAAPKKNQDGSVNPATDNTKELPIEKLRPGPYQPREIFDTEAIDALADSIKEHGIIQPIIVCLAELDDNSTLYEIIAGERRWRASQRAGLHQVPVIIRDIEPQAALAVSLIENIQREDLNPLEEARALKRLHDEYALTHEQVGNSVGRSRAAVSNLIRLLDLADTVQEMVLAKKLDMGHARALLAADKATQVDIAKQVIFKGLSVRETEALVKTYLPADKKQKSVKSKKDPNIIALEQHLSESFASKVEIQSNPKDTAAGKLVISYKNLSVLDGILAKLGVEKN